MNRIHRLPRVWSNRELRKFGHLFSGDIVNVSAWRDEDKEGRLYAEYFPAKNSYALTNFDPDKRGFQGLPGEIFLDLQEELPHDLRGNYDVVFNHTTLEHVYDFRTAFSNICAMSRDVVILVVPFVQQMHGQYGDYWRFSPQAIERMFMDENMALAYLSFNNQKHTSVYIFAIAVKHPERWKGHFPFSVDFVDHKYEMLGEPYAGCNAIRDSLSSRLLGRVTTQLRRIRSKCAKFMTRLRER